MGRKKTNVFLTGATGVMGSAGLKELMKYPELYNVKVLARDSKANRRKLKGYEGQNVEIIWGDLLDEQSLRKGIEDADVVLHVGGMVSPKADLYPEQTLKVNVGSIEKIARLAKEFENKQSGREIKVVYIGSVSQYGTKLPPDHWGSVESEQRPAESDVYAESKVKGEEILRKAGLRKWVSIRQTAILHSGLLKNALNPVALHMPLLGVLEWITTEDSGRLLERVCRPELPDSFWCKAYNAGGGEPFRLVNIDFVRGILKALGCPPPEKIFEPNWFATHNFHGMWFTDSDQLEEILHFRGKDTYQGALERLKKGLPFYFRLSPLAPPFLIKMIMKRVAHHPELGTLSWIEKNDEEKINRFWGSRENYESIKGWSEFEEIRLEKGVEKAKND